MSKFYSHNKNPQIFGICTTGTFQQVEFLGMQNYRQKLRRAIEKAKGTEFKEMSWLGRSL